MSEVDTLSLSDLDEQLEKTKEAWRRFGEQITLAAENLRGLISSAIGMLYDSEPKYIRTERKFPKKKKRGTMRRRRRERKTE